MSKLKDADRSAMALYMRSKRDDEGWAVVSAVVFPLFDDVNGQLFEIERGKRGAGRARLTELGKLLADWLI
jgi:hypothetical protein